MTRLEDNQKATCDCGETYFHRSGDTYYVAGKPFHLDGWVICHNCEDAIKVFPEIKYTDGPTPKGL